MGLSTTDRDLALSLSAGQDDGSSPLPSGDVIGAMYITPAIDSSSPAPSPESPAPILGQSFSLGATTDPYGQIPGVATPTGPGLLSDNGIYDPANPYAAGFTGWSGAQWLNVGQTLPGSGGSGSPGMPPPQTPGGGGSGGQQGQQVAQVPPTKVMAPQKGESDAGETASARFAAGQGPVTIVGIVGRYETPHADAKGQRQPGGYTPEGRKIADEVLAGIDEKYEESGFQDLSGNLKAKVKDREDPNVKYRVYGSSEGKTAKGFPDGTEESASEGEIAQGMLNDVLAAFRKKQLNGENVYRIILAGHSWGADKTVKVMSIFRELLANAVKRNRKLAGKVQVFLILIDSIDRESGLKGTPTPPDRIPKSDEVLEIFNIYENDDAPLGVAPKLPGMEYPDLPKDHNFNASEDPANFKDPKTLKDIPQRYHHEFLPRLKAVEDFIFKGLGLDGAQ